MKKILTMLFSLLTVVILSSCDEVKDSPLLFKATSNTNPEPTLKSKACLKCLYFTIIIFDLCRYLEYFSYLYTINQTE